jgi:biotin operon repressor|tara:strand:- start:357 stop:557 length:201 start_codon:yes stop_codon:yes gene_type:complete
MTSHSINKETKMEKITFELLLENFRNQSDIAEKLSISRQAVSKWFINKQIPKLRQYEIQEYLTKSV